MSFLVIISTSSSISLQSSLARHSAQCTFIVATIFVSPFHIILGIKSHSKGLNKCNVHTFDVTIVVWSTDAFSRNVVCFRKFRRTANTIEAKYITSSGASGTVHVHFASLGKFFFIEKIMKFQILTCGRPKCTRMESERDPEANFVSARRENMLNTIIFISAQWCSN